MYYLYLENGNTVISSKQPVEVDYLAIDELPSGEGIIKTDLVSVWIEPYPEKPIKEVFIPLETKFGAQQERISFLEDCIAEMAQIVYS